MGLTVGQGITWGAGADFLVYQTPPYQVTGIELNRSGLLGEYAYAGRFSQPTGLSSSGTSQFIFSCWLNPRTMPGTEVMLFDGWTTGGNVRMRISLQSATTGIVNTTLSVSFADSGNRSISFTAPTVIPCGSWSHVVVSCFVPAIAGNRVFQCYINNTAQTLSVTSNPSFTTIDFSFGRSGIFTQGFAQGTAGQTYFGSWAEYYLACTQYLDLSTTSNLRKFITAGGGTPNLGTNAENPTGTSPTIYFKGPVSTLISSPNWVNFGTGGNYGGTGRSFTYDSLTNPPSTP
jgi:hypothetical protein